MKILVVHKKKPSEQTAGGALLHRALASKPIGSLILSGLVESLPLNNAHEVRFAVPEEYEHLLGSASQNVLFYNQTIPISPETLGRKTKSKWHVISNGRFVSHINEKVLGSILGHTEADVVAVTAEPSLQASQERILLTAEDKMAGFRRVYEDSAELTPIPPDWPHHLFARANAVNGILSDSELPESFSSFRKICEEHGLSLCAVNVGGTVTDLETAEGLLSFCTAIINHTPHTHVKRMVPDAAMCTFGNNHSATPRLMGRVLIGNNVDFGNDVVVVGPTIICDNTVIGDRATIEASVIGSDVHINQDQFQQKSLLLGKEQPETDHIVEGTGSVSVYKSDLQDEPGKTNCTNHIFRVWPRLSYARSFKRIADSAIALVVLILFAPIAPLIILAIKLNSPGPALFKHKREGLHGKPFYCLKFRSMHTGSDEIQDKLRIISQVDGPQFKMEDDPRVSRVGRFLRETYIDEIPQFINVLLGHMSVIGPRPSPKKENTQCPYWRDARLSVRPGITGLWQIRRTRKPMQDFQEWIYYDIEYVRNLSFKTDLWICWKTFIKLVDNFINQF